MREKAERGERGGCAHGNTKTTTLWHCYKHRWLNTTVTFGLVGNCMHVSHDTRYHFQPEIPKVTSGWKMAPSEL